MPFCSLCILEDILGAHSMCDDDIWGETNTSYESVDTANSKQQTAKKPWQVVAS